MVTIHDDRRVDPRLKALFTMVPVISQTDVASRHEMLDEVNRPEAIAAREQMTAMLEMLDDHINAPAAGLDISTVLSLAAERRGHRPLSPGDGNRARRRPGLDRSSGHQPRDRRQHRSVLPSDLRFRRRSSRFDLCWRPPFRTV